MPEIFESIKRSYWRRGRNWENRRQGVAQKTGYFTTINKNVVDKIRTKYKLIWQIYSGYNSKYIDVFAEKDIIK